MCSKAGLGIRSRSEPSVFGSLEKKSGAGAAKNLPAPQPCEKIKSIRKLQFSYSSLGKLLSFMVKKTVILVLYFFFADLPY